MWTRWRAISPRNLSDEGRWCHDDAGHSATTRAFETPHPDDATHLSAEWWERCSLKTTGTLEDLLGLVDFGG
jgi:hypothetical protein